MTEYDWDKTIKTINTFQHGPSSKNPKKERGSKKFKVISALNKLGVSLDSLNTLNIIHISGTKGKGSTCAFIESILRNNSFKTGLFTSPHLVTILERIKINGNQMSKENFMQYFWKIYNLLDIQSSLNYGYFQFLTIFAFYIFIHENIDVAIIETGIGGEYDCTNIVTKPKIVGITSIDYDHTNLLGNELKSIAWHKAGIMRSNVIAFTVNQTEEVMDELMKRSQEINCPLIIVDDIDKYNLNNNNILNKNIKLGINGEVQKKNSSLALQISQTWINIFNNEKQIKDNSLLSSKHFMPELQFYTPSENDLNALLNTHLRGRCEIVEKYGIKYFIDGAHTIESMKNCIEWYSKVTEHTSKDDINILIFGVKRIKYLEVYIEMMKDLRFHFFLFTPNIIDKYNPSDENSYNPLALVNNCDYIEEKFKEILSNNVSDVNTYKFDCVRNTIDFVKQISDNTKQKINVLVTGSIHLVGDVLRVIEIDEN